MSESLVKESFEELSASSLIGMNERKLVFGMVECLLALRGSIKVAVFAILGVTLYSGDF